MEGCQLTDPDPPPPLPSTLFALSPLSSYPGRRQAVEGRQLIAPLLQSGLNPLEMLVL